MVCKIFFSTMVLFLSFSFHRAAEKSITCRWAAYDEPHTCFINVASIPTHPSDTMKFIYEDNYTKPSDISAVKFHSDVDKVFQMKHFPKKIFIEFPNMKTLSISSQLHRIFADDLELGINLENLVLFANRLTNIPANVFINLNKLEKLDFTFNEISSIEENAFNGLNDLRVLTLAGNRITKITSSMFNGAPNLEKLELELNLIEEIEEGALTLPKLEILNMLCNKLTTLSQNQPFKHCNSLRNLILGSNDLISIGTALSSLNKLETLDLSMNKLNDVRLQELVNLPQLIKLSLLGNGPSLNDSIFFEFRQSRASSAVAVLNLQGNGIGSHEILIKLKMWGVTQIEFLDLTHNLFKNIDLSWINSFAALKTIKLFNNPLDCNWFSDWKRQLEPQQSKLFVKLEQYFSMKCRSED